MGEEIRTGLDPGSEDHVLADARILEELSVTKDEDLGGEIRDSEDIYIEAENKKEAFDESKINEEVESESKNSAFKLLLRDIKDLPVPTPEEEEKYGRMLKGTEKERKTAVEFLVTRNIRYVIHIAKRYVSENYPMEDAVQNGCMGLMRAAELYDIDKGYRFTTYATWWIKQSVMRQKIEEEKLIRIPVHIYEMISKINRAETDLQKQGIEPTDERLSKLTGIPLRDIADLRQKTQSVLSLNARVGPDDDSAELIEFLPDENNVAEKRVEQQDLRRIFEAILPDFDEKEQEILRLRYGFDGPPMTLEEIGKMNHVTRERIRQIEERMLKKFRKPKYRKFLKEFIK